MPINIEGSLKADGKKFAIIAARFNDFITEKLVGGAIDALIRSGADEKDIEIYKVPGAFEMPLIAKKLVKKENHDAIICLGAVIRGATAHFDYVCNEVRDGVRKVTISTQKEIVFEKDLFSG